MAENARLSRARRTDGSDELSAANNHLRNHFLRLRFRSIRQIRRARLNADCARHLSVSNNHQRILVQIFRLRSNGMDLATINLRKTP